MNFRLGLLDLEQPSSSAKPSHSNWQSNDCAASLASQSSGAAEQHPFIAKYGKVIQENHRKSQSQANQLATRTNKSSQSAQEFLEKYGAKLMEKKLFKEPPVKYPTPLLHQRTRNLEMNASKSCISSIHSTEPVAFQTRTTPRGWDNIAGREWRVWECRWVAREVKTLR